MSSLIYIPSKTDRFRETLNYTNVSQMRNLREALNKNPVVVAETVFEALDYVGRGG